MIDKALEVLSNSIHDYLIRLPDLNITSQQTVHLTNITDYNGALTIPNDSLGFSLVNVEEERVVKSQKTVFQASNGQVSHLNPEIKLNLFVLITANFSNYSTSLEFLSGAIRFFQSKNVFDHQNTPRLDPAIQKLIVDIYTLNFEQQNHLWGALGGKYLPSVMYKVRLISIQEALKKDEQPPIKIADFSERGI